MKSAKDWKHDRSSDPATANKKRNDHHMVLGCVQAREEQVVEVSAKAHELYPSHYTFLDEEATSFYNMDHRVRVKRPLARPYSSQESAIPIATAFNEFFIETPCILPLFLARCFMMIDFDVYIYI